MSGCGAFAAKTTAMTPGAGARSVSTTTRPIAKLVLTGDVMLGRGIDALNRVHVDPVIYETCCRSALDYVALARRRSGHPPKDHPAAAYHDPARVWGTLFPHLTGAADEEDRDRSASDRVPPDAPRVLLVNLETAVTSRGNPWPAKGINYRTHPANVAALTAANVTFCALANNHVLDWSKEGLVDTLTALDAASIAHAGAGANAAEAWAPAAIPLGEDGDRALIVSVAHASSGVPSSWAAGPLSSGVARVEYTDEGIAAVAAAFDSIGACAGAEVRIVSIHWGGNWGWDPEPGQIAFAHALVDRAGVNVVWGHSSHHVKAIEVYRGALVLYGCGDLINDYEGIEHLSAAEFRDSVGLLYEATIGTEGGPAGVSLMDLSMLPTRIKYLAVNHAEGGGVEEDVDVDDASWLAGVLTREGRRLGFGTSVEVNGVTGKLRLRWPRTL